MESRYAFAKQWALEKLGQTPVTTDAYFKGLQTNVAMLHDAVRAIRDGSTDLFRHVQDVCTTSCEVSRQFAGLFDGCEHALGPAAHQFQKAQYAFRDDHLPPLREAHKEGLVNKLDAWCEELGKLQYRATQRERARMKLDHYRYKIEQLRDKKTKQERFNRMVPHKESERLNRNEHKLDDARKEYERLNEDVTEELRAMWNGRADRLDTFFRQLVQGQSQLFQLLSKHVVDSSISALKPTEVLCIEAAPNATPLAVEWNQSVQPTYVTAGPSPESIACGAASPHPMPTLRLQQGSQPEGVIRTGEATQSSSRVSIAVAPSAEVDEDASVQKRSFSERMLSKFSFSRKKKDSDKNQSTRQSLSNQYADVNEPTSSQAPTQPNNQPHQHQYQSQIPASMATPPSPVTRPPPLMQESPSVNLSDINRPMMSQQEPKGEEPNKTWAKFDDSTDYPMPVPMNVPTNTKKQRKRCQSKPGIVMDSHLSTSEVTKSDRYGLTTIASMNASQSSVSQPSNDPFAALGWGMNQQEQAPYSQEKRTNASEQAVPNGQNPPPVIPNYGLSLDPFADIDNIPLR